MGFVSRLQPSPRAKALWLCLICSQSPRPQWWFLKHKLIICKNLFLPFIQNFTQKLKSLPSISISLLLKSQTWKLTISKLNINSLFLWMILVTRRPEHIRDDNIHHIPILIFNLFEENISIVKTIFTDLYFYRTVKTLIFFIFLWRVCIISLSCRSMSPSVSKV